MIKHLICLLSVLFLTAFSVELLNGENVFCPNKSYLDVVESYTEVKVRFTCVDSEKGFEKVLSVIGEDTRFIEVVRTYTIPDWGLGMIIRDGQQVVQIYKLTRFFYFVPGAYEELWRAK